jgi:hypothetical protein
MRGTRPLSWMGGAAVVVTAVLCGACSLAVAPVGFVFSPAVEDGNTLKRVVWLERVEIAQPVLPDQDLIETAFTYNFARVLRQKKAFQTLKIETGVAAPEDWVLRLRIDRCTQRGRIPVLSYIATPLTLGLYQAFGRKQVLEFEIAGTFEIRDGSGKRVASGEASHSAQLDVYQKNITNAFSFFLDERSRFVDELLEKMRIATEEGEAS